MNKDKLSVGLMTGLVFGIFGVILTAIIFSSSFSDSYKKGQVDVLTGRVHYEKITHKDQTITWEKIAGKGGE